jgi:hypothetical protein
MKSPLELIRLAWSQVLLALTFGILLSLIPESRMYWGTFHHIGLGLLVAAVVTLFWHLREFADFFERFARTILISDDYLSRLSYDTLSTVRARAGREMLKTRVNNPKYQHKELLKWVDEVLYGKCFPGPLPSSWMYREAYSEKISLEHMTLETALNTVEADTSKVPKSALDSPIHKITTTATFEVLSPRLEAGLYPLQMSGRFADLPHFPLQKRLTFRGGYSESTAKSIHVTATNREKGGIDFEAEPRSLTVEGGSCSVWIETVEYKSPRLESHILNTMNMLTHGLTVDLFQVGAGPRLRMDAGMIATEICQPRHSPGSIRLEVDGWLFQHHGYCIWFWEPEASSEGAENLSGEGSITAELSAPPPSDM